MPDQNPYEAIATASSAGPTANPYEGIATGSDAPLNTATPGASPQGPQPSANPYNDLVQYGPHGETTLTKFGKSLNPASITPDQAITLSAQADCSLFTQRVFGNAGIPIPRTAIQQFKATPLVAPRGQLDPKKLQPGDLVFFDNGLRTPFNTQGKQITDHWGDTVGYVNHVGIYQGNGKVIHDPGNGTAAVVPLSHFAGMKFMGATRPVATPSQPPQYGIGGSPAPNTPQPVAAGSPGIPDAYTTDLQDTKHLINVARKSGDAIGLDSANAMLAQMQKEGKAAYNLRMAQPNQSGVMEGQAMDAQRRYLLSVYGKTKAQLTQEDPGFDLRGVASANEVRGRMTGQIANVIEPVTHHLSGIAKVNPITNWIAQHVFGQDTSKDYLGKAAADLATSPLRPLIAAGGVPEDVAKGPMQGVYALGQFVLETAMVEGGLPGEGVVSGAVGQGGKLALQVTKDQAGAIGTALKDVAQSAVYGPRSVEFAKALRAAQASGVDLEALAKSVGRDQGNYRSVIQQIARNPEAGPVIGSAPGGMADLLNKQFQGPTIVPEQFAGLQREQFIRQWGMTRQEGLINAMRDQIAGTKGAGRAVGPMVRQLEAAQAAGKIHPTIRDEAGQLWDRQNPDMAGASPVAVQHVPETPVPVATEPVVPPKVDMGMNAPTVDSGVAATETRSRLSQPPSPASGSYADPPPYTLDELRDQAGLPATGQAGAAEESSSLHPSKTRNSRFFVDRGADGRARGILIYDPSDRSLSVLVDPGFRRQGIASTLYKLAEDRGVPINDVTGNSGYTEMGAAFNRARVAKSAEPGVASDEFQRPKLEDITAAAERIGAELDPGHTTTWNATAEKAVRDGHVRNALAEAMSLKPNKVTKEHIFGWGIRFQQVERELNAAMASGDDAAAAALNHEGETILNAIKAANSEAGARLASANALLTNDMGAIALRIKGRKAVGGRALTSTEQAPLDQAAQDYAANQAQQQAVLANKAQQTLDTAPAANPGPKRIISDEAFAAAKARMKALGDQSGTQFLGSGPLTDQMLKDMVIIVGHHIEDGIRTVGELVAKLKEAGASDEHAWQGANAGVQAFVGKMNAGRSFGEDILTEGKSAIQSSDIAALRKELDALKAESKLSQNTADAGLLTKLRNQVKQLEGMQGKPVNLDEYKALREQIGKTSQQLNAGRGLGEDILTSGNTLKGGSGIQDPEIAALRVQAEKIKMGADAHIKALQAAEDYANLSTFGKGRAQLQDLMNAPRTLKASVDFSAPLRQGIFFSITHPGLTAHSMPSMFTSFGSKAAYEDLMAAMRAGEHWDLAQNSGLFIADADAPLLLNHKEEMFASRVAEKVPGVAPSERAYAAFLNKQRFDMFSHYADAAIASGKPLTATEAENIANFINVATGRGTGRMADMAAGLGQAFFAPRYTVSRFQLAFGGPLWKSIQETGWTSASTKIIAKEYAKFYGTALITMGIMKAAGVNIGTDPRSTDFGKIIRGNSRVDIFGGVQQPIRLVSQLLRGRVDKDGVLTPPSPSEWADITGRYLMQKENPMLSVPYQLWTGKDAVGQPYDAKRGAVDLLSPLSIQQGYDSIKEEGPLVGGMMIAADVFGAATNIQEPKSDPFGAPYTAAGNSDAVFKELRRIGYAHPINQGKGEPQAEYDARRQDFEKFAYPEIKAMLDDPSFQRLTKKEKQLEVKAKFAELTKDYNAGPGAEGYDKRRAAIQAPVDAEIAAQQKAGIH